jgi:DNA-binding MarR family transcriptional regulator
VAPSRSRYSDNMLAPRSLASMQTRPGAGPARSAPRSAARLEALPGGQDAPLDRVQAYRQLMSDVYELAAVMRRANEPEAARVGITGAQWHTLGVLADGPATVPAIAERLGVTRQAIQRVADELVSAHLVQRRPNPQHARSPLHRITPEGRRRLERLAEESLTPRAQATDQVALADLVTASAVVRELLDGLRGTAAR